MNEHFSFKNRDLFNNDQLYHKNKKAIGIRRQQVITWKDFLSGIILFFSFGIIIDSSIKFFEGLIESFFEVDLPFFLSPFILKTSEGIFLFLTLLIIPKLKEFILIAIDFTVLRCWKTYFYVIAGFLLMLFSSTIIDIIHLDSPDVYRKSLGIDKLHDWFNIFLFLLVSVLIAPLAEEFLFRGLLHRFLEQRYHFWVGLIVSSVLFGWTHPGSQYNSTIHGFIFGLTYHTTKSIVPAILLHSLWNAFASISYLTDFL